MKSSYINLLCIIVFFLGLFYNTEGIAQELNMKQYRTLYKFKTEKQADNSRLLEVSFIVRNKKNKKDKIPVYGAEINFYSFLGDELFLLGTTKTSKKGIAQLILPENQKYLTYEGNKFNLSARFKGNKKLKSQKRNITVKDLFLNLDLTEKDSIKTVHVKALTVDSLGNKIPAKEAIAINFYVDSFLSKMKINEGILEDGIYSFEFPSDIPGDVNGDLKIIASIEDSDEYGNVEKMENANWGIYNKSMKKKKNTLWSNAAPLWMYILLSILLVGVWANYLYTIIYLFKIKKEGKLLS